MINSPGGIQAWGDVHVGIERPLIRTISIELWVEEQTEMRSPAPPEVDVGNQVAFALFTRTKRRIRFVTDWRVEEHQLTATTRRLRLEYEPESPRDILGEDVSELADVEILAMNMSELFQYYQFARGDGPLKMGLAVFVNGIEVATRIADISAAELATGQMTISVAELFDTIPEVYRQKTR